MPRRLRFDAAGVLHHLFNRGIARRTAFETRRDVRHFLALLAVEVRRGRIEILAFAVLTTHFHILIRSRTGDLSLVMQRVMNQYVRYFNRTRRRDGPLFRARFGSKPVGSERYLRLLLRYIDQNAVQAGLASTPTEYAYGSARLYVCPRRPKWLASEHVDSILMCATPSERAVAYARVFGRPLHRDEASILQQRMGHPGDPVDDWDDLMGAAAPEVLDWMRRKAHLADGTKPGLPYVAAERVDRVVDTERACAGAWSCKARARRRDAWPILRMGLWRDLAGHTLAEIGRRARCHPATAALRVAHHVRLLDDDEVYAVRAAELARRCLQEHEA